MANHSGEKMKRYNLVLPEEVVSRVEAAAKRKGTTTVKLFRSIIKLGLLAAELEGKPNAALIIREDDKEREVILP